MVILATEAIVRKKPSRASRAWALRARPGRPDVCRALRCTAFWAPDWISGGQVKLCACNERLRLHQLIDRMGEDVLREYAKAQIDAARRSRLHIEGISADVSLALAMQSHAKDPTTLQGTARRPTHRRSSCRLSPIWPSARGSTD